MIMYIAISRLKTKNWIKLNDYGFNKSLNSLVVKDSGFSAYEILPGHFRVTFLGHYFRVTFWVIRLGNTQHGKKFGKFGFFKHISKVHQARLITGRKPVALSSLHLLFHYAVLIIDN